MDIQAIPFFRTCTTDLKNVRCLVREQGYILVCGSDDESIFADGMFIEYRIYVQEGARFICQRVFWSEERGEHSDVVCGLDVEKLRDYVGDHGLSKTILDQVDAYIGVVQEKSPRGVPSEIVRKQEMQGKNKINVLDLRQIVEAHRQLGLFD